MSSPAQECSVGLSNISNVGRFKFDALNGHIRNIIVTPGIFRRQEVIPAYKLKKLSPGLLFGVKLIYHSGWLITVATGLLYYFRLQYR